MTKVSNLMPEFRFNYAPHAYRKPDIIRRQFRAWKNEALDIVHRGLYGYAKSDLYSLDWYLSRVIVNSLEHYVDGHAAPDMGFDNYGGIDNIKPLDNKNKEEWANVVKTMQDGFKAHMEMCFLSTFNPDIQTYDEWIGPLNERWTKGIEAFHVWFGALWD